MLLNVGCTFQMEAARCYSGNKGGFCLFVLSFCLLVKITENSIINKDMQYFKTVTSKPEKNMAKLG